MSTWCLRVGPTTRGVKHVCTRFRSIGGASSPVTRPSVLEEVLYCWVYCHQVLGSLGSRGMAVTGAERMWLLVGADGEEFVDEEEEEKEEEEEEMELEMRAAALMAAKQTAEAVDAPPPGSAASQQRVNLEESAKAGARTALRVIEDLQVRRARSAFLLLASWCATGTAAWLALW